MSSSLASFKYLNAVFYAFPDTKHVYYTIKICGLLLFLHLTFFKICSSGLQTIVLWHIYYWLLDKIISTTMKILLHVQNSVIVNYSYRWTRRFVAFKWVLLSPRSEWTVCYMHACKMWFAISSCIATAENFIWKSLFKFIFH